MRKVVMDASLQALAYRAAGERETLDFLKENVLSTTDYPDYERMAFFGVANKTTFEQAIWALTAPLTPSEYNPQPLTYYDTMQGFGNSRYITIHARNYAHAQQLFNRIAMMNPDYSPRFGFNTTARNGQPGTNDGLGFFGNFGDGLPLVLPTTERVQEMLAGSERGRFPDDVLGWLKLQGGAITVEKVAINAVMAGAEPEHFPIILAAMELLANGWDYDKMWYHAMTTGAPNTMVIMLNGPLGEELGISGAEGSSAGANQINNVIGRAIRLNYRNLGHISREIDDHQYKGREHDFTMVIFREQEEYLPGWDAELWETQGANPRPDNMWAPHHVEQGFRPQESTITIWAYSRIFPNDNIAGGEPNFWTPPGPAVGSMNFNYFGVFLMASNTVNYLALSPGMAQTLFETGVTSKNQLRANVPAQQPEWGVTRPDARATGFHPIVSGGDMAPVRPYFGFMMTYDNRNHQTNLITGATLTQHGRAASIFDTNHIGVANDRREIPGYLRYGMQPDASAGLELLDPARSGVESAWLPSAPQNVEVTFSPGSIPGRVDATVTWDAPICDGNSPIIAYHIAFTHGGDIQKHTVTDASSGRVNLGLEPEPQTAGTYVHAWYSLHNHDSTPGFALGTSQVVKTSGADRIYAVAGTARYIVFENMPPYFETFFRVRAINGLRNAIEVDANNALAHPALGGSPFVIYLRPYNTARGSGRGAWAVYRGDAPVGSYRRGVLVPDLNQPEPDIMWTVNFDTGGGTYIPAVTVPAGTAFSEVVAGITPPTREGYEFVAWRFFNWDATVCSGNFFVNYHNTLIAVWEALPPPVVMWTVNFDTGGGTPIPSVTVPAGTAFSEVVADITPPTREGYTFVAWRFFNWNATVCSGNFFVNYHNTLIAVWEALPPMWTITFNTGGGTPVPAVSVPAGTAFRDVVANVTPPTRAGYNFVTWRFSNWDATVCSGNFFVGWHNTLIAVWEAE